MADKLERATDKQGRARTAGYDPDRPGYAFSSVLNDILTEIGVSCEKVAIRLRGPDATNWLQFASAGTRLLSAKNLAVLLSYEELSPEQKLRLRWGYIQAQIGFKKYPRPSLARDSKIDMGVISALNLDIIVPRPDLDSREASAHLDSFTFDPEVRLGSYGQFYDAFLKACGLDDATLADGYRFEIELGGSGWNVARLIAESRIGLQVCCVGVSGNLLPKIAKRSGYSRQHRSYAEEIGIDVRFMQDPEGKSAGHCLSILLPRGRTLQRHMGTWPAVNDQLNAYLIENFWSIVDRLHRARIIHVTSLLDDSSPEIIATLLEQIVRLNPHACFSFDPGHIWAAAHENRPRSVRAIRRILRVTNLLFLAEQELESLAKTYIVRKELHTDETSNAHRVLGLLSPATSTIIVVKRAGITSIYNRQSEFRPIRLANLLADKDIVDDTGAGDAFAAGYLCGWLAGRAPGMCAQIGMQLARCKLLTVGAPAQSDVRRIVQGLLTTT